MKKYVYILQMEIVTSVKFNDNEESSPNSYNYDIGILRQFSEKYGLKLHVYSKNPSMTLYEPERIIEETPIYRLIEIPDIGRCDYSFIYHIVHHYDKLPPHLYFTKSNINDKILLDEINYVLFLNKYKYINVGQHLKVIVFGNTPDFTDLPEVGQDDIENHSLSYKHNFPNEKIHSYRVMDFFGMVYGKDTKLPDTWVAVEFGHGPCFRVCRELILRHPKNVYETLLDTFFPEKNHWDLNANINMSLPEQMNEIGKIYHDQFARFWTLLFTYGTYMTCETDFENVLGFFV